MRISERIRTLLKEAVRESFGEVDVYLFGSRTDDAKRGGDIDLAVDVGQMEYEEFRAKKVRFATRLFQRDFECRVDVVRYTPPDETLAAEIRCSAIKL